MSSFLTEQEERGLQIESPGAPPWLVAGLFSSSITRYLTQPIVTWEIKGPGTQGAADVLGALGSRLGLPPERSERSIDELGFGFLFAQAHHPAMRHAGPTRREIGIRTAFNLLGPLTNPAGTRRQVIGVGDPTAAERIAEVARRLGTERTLVVHGAGVDELPLDGSGVIHDVRPDGIATSSADPVELGLAVVPLGALAGGTPETNAALVEAILGGELGPRRDAVLLNAGAAFVAAGTSRDLAGGVALARATIVMSERSSRAVSVMKMFSASESTQAMIPAARGEAKPPQIPSDHGLSRYRPSAMTVVVSSAPSQSASSAIGPAAPDR